jgi:8-oxo-dGTP pyrophosphatase MutT (NUDIX family)
MDELDIYVSKRKIDHSRVREGMLLLSYEANTYQWFLPGGGLEDGESRESGALAIYLGRNGNAV